MGIDTSSSGGDRVDLIGICHLTAISAAIRGNHRANLEPID